MLALGLADDLAGGDVDDVARRRIDSFSVDTDRHPEDTVRRVDGGDLLGVFVVAEDVNLLENSVRQPDFLAVRRDGNAVAGATMRDAGARGLVPDRAPVNAGDFHRLQNFARLGVGNQIAEKIVLVDVYLGGILVQDL